MCDFVSISGSGFGYLTYKWKVVYLTFSSFGFLVWGISGNGGWLIPLVILWKIESITIDRAGLVALKFG
ncbi:unnamed protein product [Citrullus colocynthis]|uniref:Uncharacterized protein n=1 Tax=Citrullus colocynthis TaxID=252529 RepID=A0ABP0Y8F8_9ROSI